MKLGFTFFLILAIGLSQIPTKIASSPSEATVFIDGNKIGETPVKNVALSVGKHVIDLSKKQFAPIHYDIYVQPAKSLEISFQMNELHSITFKSKEEGLKFSLNQIHNWEDRKIKLEIEEGEHAFRVFDSDSLIDERVLYIDGPSKIIYQFEKDSLSNK